MAAPTNKIRPATAVNKISFFLNKLSPSVLNISVASCNRGKDLCPGIKLLARKYVPIGKEDCVWDLCHCFKTYLKWTHDLNHLSSFWCQILIWVGIIGIQLS